jgi:gliding motility-associated-like protein
MKKLYAVCILFFCFAIKAKADHITGGEIFYTYSSASNGTNTYNVTFKLFMRCNSHREFYNPTIVSIFDKETSRRYTDITVSLSRSETISIQDPDPCVTDPPTVCYVVGYYNFSVTLPVSGHGYILSSQVNYRIQGISNLEKFYSNIGALYTAEIPGTAAVNNSARFSGTDLVVVCANNRFTYNFGANDPDGDKLRYSFCQAYRSGGGGNNIIPPPEPPYQSVPYGNGFTANTPLGDNVKIDPETGVITGTAPDAGIYVVTVCVEEIRNGVVIATQRKDLQINIAPCNIAAALLQNEYQLCKDSKTINLINLSNSPLIRTYYWELTNRAGNVTFTSTSPTAVYTFPDTGIYKIKLSINRGQTCNDSTTSLARVYPGFVPDFSFKGICYTKPTEFTDLTKSKYGVVNAWLWSFDTGDTSSQKNPTYTYTTQGNKNVALIVKNTVGCIDTVVKPVAIVTEPPMSLAFSDTLICKGDRLTLHAFGEGNFSWSPVANIINSNTASPTVSPTATTTYTATLNDNGCIAKQSLAVRVTDHVNLQVMNDTTICSGDTVQLRIESDAFSYSWTPAEQVIDAGVANPLVVTTASTNYTVTARIGGCATNGNVTIKTVPYPYAYAGRDTSICNNTAVQLQGITDGSSFSWSPSIGLNNADLINPIATPPKTTAYILYATNTKGCPKPGKDTVVVNVLSPVIAFAGNDTSALVEQPLQLNATGGTSYLWSPNIGLSATNIANPIAFYNDVDNSSVRYKVVVYNEANCEDSAFITVKIFTTGPSVFVPTAFTPNADGKNDILRPIAVGIKQIDFFRVYNRWGQLMFTSQAERPGWDGSYNGVAQTTGTYVWVVKAVDYNGRPYLKKGTVVLLK